MRMTKDISYKERVFLLSSHEGDCWIWQAYINPRGYGMMGYKGQARLSHRVAYLEYIGPIPDGKELDHLCRNTACVNPYHMEPVTHAENVKRGIHCGKANRQKTRCKYGHEYDQENTYNRPDGKGRDCKKCMDSREAKRLPRVYAIQGRK